MGAASGLLRVVSVLDTALGSCVYPSSACQVMAELYVSILGCEPCSPSKLPACCKDFKDRAGGFQRVHGSWHLRGILEGLRSFLLLKIVEAPLTGSGFWGFVVGRRDITHCAGCSPDHRQVTQGCVPEHTW